MMRLLPYTLISSLAGMAEMDLGMGWSSILTHCWDRDDDTRVFREAFFSFPEWFPIVPLKL